MSILASMKEARLQARRDRNSEKSATLGTLIGDIELFGKNAGRDVTDAESIAILKKFIKNAEESNRVAGDYRDSAACDRIGAELEVYAEFLPKQMTREALVGVMTNLSTELGIETLKGRGVLMKTLKERFEGLYDGATAATIASEILKA